VPEPATSLALQLYSLRREMAANPEATLRRVPALGYDAIELAGTYNWPTDKWKKLLTEANLKVVGAHCGCEQLEKEWASQSVFSKAVGNRRLIVSSLPERFRSPDGYRQAAGVLNTFGQRARDDGFRLLYHNHSFEFDPLNDQSCGMDTLLRETDPALVAFEVDTYWVERGGRDSRQFIEERADRIGMIHAKELRKKDQADVPAGQGDIDFKFIVSFARKHGWPIVVEFEGENAVEAVVQSARYLSAL
jgi:sugar phosphate isomerase/epimerase